MDPNFNKLPGLSLPAPSDEKGSFAAPATGLNVDKKETLPVDAEQKASQMQGASTGAATLIDDPQVNNKSYTPPMDGNSTAAASAQAADDDKTDALDQEWVNKAKAIVDKTRTDPFVESRELSKVKADFLRARYNKYIKIIEEKP